MGAMLPVTSILNAASEKVTKQEQQNTTDAIAVTREEKYDFEVLYFSRLSTLISSEQTLLFVF